MNLELILWIIAGIVIWEVSFITSCFGKDASDWLDRKFLIGMCLIGFLFLQSIIIKPSFYCSWQFNECIPSHNYIYLLYEAIILIGIYLFFYANKKIANHVSDMEEDNA